MKLILTSIFSLISVILLAQTFQITLKPGSQANSFKVVMKPNANLSGGQLSAYQITVLLPNTITPRPNLSVLNNPIAGITPNAPVMQTNVVTDGSYYSYQLDAVGTATVPITNYVANTEYDLLELAFSDGPPNMAQVKVAQLPGGGLLGINNNYLEFNGNDLTNALAMFYGTNLLNSLLGYAGYSYVALNNVLLPTKFLSFYATKSNDDTKLTWTVDNEENNNYFEVQGSTDGRTFRTVQRVNALRNGRLSNTYGTTDINISRYNVKTVYYRIKQVEADGNVIYSEIRQVNLTDKNFSASLYPNPVKTITKLVVDAPEATKATILVRDASGKTVQQTSIQLAKGINQHQIDATLFAAGDYNVTIVSDKLNQTIKLTKAN